MDRWFHSFQRASEKSVSIKVSANTTNKLKYNME